MPFSRPNTRDNQQRRVQAPLQDPTAGGPQAHVQEKQQFKDRVTVTSVSQVELGIRCMRKWWLQYIAGLKEPPKPAFLFGGPFHDAAERAIKGQEPWVPGWSGDLDVDQTYTLRWLIEEGMMNGILKPDPTALTEVPFSFKTGRRYINSDGLPEVMEFDLVEENGNRRIKPKKQIDIPAMIGFIDVLKPLQVEDHKTSKNKRYAKTTKSIQAEIQMKVYAIKLLKESPSVDYINAAYNMFLKSREDKPYKVTGKLHKEDVAKTWLTICDVVEEQLHWSKSFPRHKWDKHRADSYAQIPVGKTYPKCCEAFFGCIFRDLCEGRCSPEQMVTRVETALEIAKQKENQPARAAAGRSVPQRFGLNFRTTQ
jgi:hypothetical protein